MSDETGFDRRFLGTWRLAGVEREDAASGQKLDQDITQSGYISYTPDRRMMVIIARHAAGKPDEYTCYAARWSVDGDVVYHDIDLALRAPWVGTRQIRGFRFDGNRLILTPPESPDFLHGTVTRRSLTWEKVEA